MKIKKILFAFLIGLILFPMTTFATAQFKLTINAKDTDLNDISGFSYEIKSEETGVIYNLDLADKSSDYMTLPAGKYKITETVTADGYQKASDINITMDKDQEVFPKHLKSEKPDDKTPDTKDPDKTPSKPGDKDKTPEDNSRDFAKTGGLFGLDILKIFIPLVAVTGIGYAGYKQTRKK